MGHLVETIGVDLIEMLAGPPEPLFSEEQIRRATSLQIWRADPSEPSWTEYRLFAGEDEFARARLPGE